MDCYLWDGRTTHVHRTAQTTPDHRAPWPAYGHKIRLTDQSEKILQWVYNSLVGPATRARPPSVGSHHRLPRPSVRRAASTASSSTNAATIPHRIPCGIQMARIGSSPCGGGGSPWMRKPIRRHCPSVARGTNPSRVSCTSNARMRLTTRVGAGRCRTRPHPPRHRQQLRRLRHRGGLKKLPPPPPSPDSWSPISPPPPAFPSACCWRPGSSPREPRRPRLLAIRSAQPGTTLPQEA